MRRPNNGEGLLNKPYIFAKSGMCVELSGSPLLTSDLVRSCVGISVIYDLVLVIGDVN